MRRWVTISVKDVPILAHVTAPRGVKNLVQGTGSCLSALLASLHEVLFSGHAKVNKATAMNGFMVERSIVRWVDWSIDCIWNEPMRKQAVTCRNRRPRFACN
jgi:hypothetical protein